MYGKATAYASFRNDSNIPECDRNLICFLYSPRAVPEGGISHFVRQNLSNVRKLYRNVAKSLKNSINSLKNWNYFRADVSCSTYHVKGEEM